MLTNGIWKSSALSSQNNNFLSTPTIYWKVHISRISYVAVTSINNLLYSSAFSTGKSSMAIRHFQNVHALVLAFLLWNKDTGYQNFWKVLLAKKEISALQQTFQNFWMLFLDTDYRWTRVHVIILILKYTINVKMDHLLCLVISGGKLEKDW